MIKEIMIFLYACVCSYMHIYIRTWTEIYYNSGVWGCSGGRISWRVLRVSWLREDAEGWKLREGEDQCCTCQDPIKGIETHGRTGRRAGGVS
jgi:hypothetical protein